MRNRVGYRGPAGLRHGMRFPGGRRNNGGMSELERLVHLIASLEILFGSRRGGWIIPLVIVGLAVGGWFLYRYQFSPERSLERAHQMYESSDTKQRIRAIEEYKELLLKSDPIEPGRYWLLVDRDTLYRRIIRHEILFAEDEGLAAEWITRAWDEGYVDLRFQNERVIEFWNQTLERLKRDTRRKPGDRVSAVGRSRPPRLMPENLGRRCVTAHFAFASSRVA